MSEYIPEFIGLLVAIVSSQGFWTWFSSKRNRSNEILEKVECVEKTVTNLAERVQTIEEMNEMAEARNCRNRIVRFADEIRSGKKASKDYYDHIMTDIDLYENYCDDHPDFYNSIAKVSVSKILEHYRNDDFL